jgi:carbon-monoxide dehydrogenase small subunit
MSYSIAIMVNGEEYRLQVDAEETLVDTIRNRLGLTGTKKGCGAGDCGSCTVILNGKAVNSCIILSVEADGASIQTIEGLRHGNEIHPLQRAFIEHGAIQCGFCTPGMIMSAKALLDVNRQPTEEQIKTAISGNLCRCTGYLKIIEAISNESRNNGQDK